MIKHYKAVLLSDIHRVWHFMTTVSTKKEDTGTLSYFVLIQVFSHRETLGETMAAHLTGSGHTNRKCRTLNVKNECLSGNAVSSWHAGAPTDRPVTPQAPFDGISSSCLGSCDIVATLAMSPREEIPPLIQMPRTLVLAQAISATPFTSAGFRDSSTCTCRKSQWPQWCPCANSAALSGMDWSAAALPWHYSLYTSPFLSNKPQDHIS